MLRRLAIALLLLTPLFALAYTSPGKPAGHVNDFAQMLTPQTRQNLEGMLRQFETETGAEIAIVTIPTQGSDETIETYAVKLFEEWGIGKKKEDNGLLLLISRDDREMKIEVGYGLEPVITDIESSRIIREVLTPAFKEGKYDEGIMNAAERMLSDIKNGAPPTPSEPVSPKLDFLGQYAFLIIFGLVYFGSILSRSKSFWAGGVIGAILGLIAFGILAAVILGLAGLLFDYLVSKNYNKHKDRGTRPPWFIGGGGWGGGEGRGGGFGGFGGGMSGGGGASGRW